MANDSESLEPRQPQPLARAGELVLPVPPQVLDVEPEEGPHFEVYWHNIIKHRWLILSCFLVVFSTVAIGTLKQKPIYEGKVLLEINPETPNIVNFKEILQIQSTDLDAYRETQYKVLQSRTLAERVVQALELYRIPEFYRRRFLFGLLESDPNDIPISSDQGPPDPSTTAYRNSVARFQDSLTVEPVRRSNLIEVSYYSFDPKLAARIANQLANDYIIQNLQVKWDAAAKASEWLEGQIRQFKIKLEKSEDILQGYAQANSILFVEEKQNMATARLKQLQEEYVKAQADRIQRQSLYDLVQAGEVQDLPGFLANLLIQNLELRKAELERDYAQITAMVKPEYPKAVQLKKQLDTIQADLNRQKMALAQNIIDDYRSAAAREKYVAHALEQAKREANDIAEKSITYNILKREVDTNKQLYEGLLQRLKEAQLTSGMNASNIRVVDASEVPKRPVKPRVILNLAMGVILGLGLGIGLAFFQEYLDDTFKTPDDVETVLRLPALGIIPTFPIDGKIKGADEKMPSTAISRAAPIVGTIQSKPAVLESFRSLRTSILLSASPVPKVILVTSALPGEGKTCTVVNLGVTFAGLCSKVVVVDCDMRRPFLHRSTGVKNAPGFVQCLTGHVDLADAILPVAGVENLSVIPCGPIPPNPAEILSSPLAGDLLTRLRNEFDFVLVDSPPLLSVADGRILSILTDAVVLVVRAFKTPYDMVRRARSLLSGAGARILGIALNDVDIRRDGYQYSYYYRYGYGYAYGYESSAYGYESSDQASGKDAQGEDPGI